MPKTKLENFVFTVIMAFIMVYAMICVNGRSPVPFRCNRILRQYCKLQYTVFVFTADCYGGMA